MHSEGVMRIELGKYAGASFQKELCYSKKIGSCGILIGHLNFKHGCGNIRYVFYNNSTDNNEVRQY